MCLETAERAPPRVENLHVKEESMEHGEEVLPLSPTEIDALADHIAVTAAHIDAATHRLLTLIRDFDRAGGWHRQGALSCAHWLSWRIGLGLGPAREKLRVAHKLAELPLLDEAFRQGELSYSKLRAMTRVASPDNEAALLDLARNSTAAQLEQICRLYRRAHPPERTGSGGDDERRWVVARPTDDGMVAIQIRLHPEEAARLMRAIEHCADKGSLADGAVALADVGLAGAAGADGGDGPMRPPVEVVAHVAAATLEGHTHLGDGLSAETCRRVLCDAGVVPMLEDDAGKTIDVGRKSRTIPAALRRALEARDPTCCFPGCAHRRWLDAHHVVHWIDGGETNLGNTQLCCRRHHGLLHEGGFRVEMQGAEPVFFDPDGREIVGAPARPVVREDAVEWLAAANRARGIEISAGTSGPGWDGWPVDYDACVGAIGGYD
ncbi:MAG TPA: DUF222 domain-containing protein [Kofleriaceae bacterium]|nr:DUF222 domain-containing protein [Kofleriaceae bacterium]